MRRYRPNYPPTIKSFSVNKVRVQKGEEVIISWQTQNADIVKVLPFGLQKGYGEKAIRITEFKDGQFQLLLHVTNSLLNKTIVQGITITEVFENKSEEFRSEVEDLFKAERPTSLNSSGISRGQRILFVVLFIAIIIVAILQNR